MKLINNIKFNYNQKLLEDYFISKKYDQAYLLLKKKLDSDPNLFIKLITLFESKYILDQKLNSFHNNKLIWITSFDSEDTLYINNFIKFYFNNLSEINVIYSYPQLLRKIISETKFINFSNELNFNFFINNSNLLQNLILFYLNQKQIFLNTRAAFFESSNNKFFTYPNLTRAYIFIVRNPLTLYSRYQSKYKSSQQALNEIFNFDAKMFDDDLENNFKFKIYENRQNWNVHTKSWIDPNVRSTFRGLSIKYESLLKNPGDTLIEILYHLKGSGLRLDIKYDIIDAFLKNEQPKFEKYDEISNHEKKSLRRDLDKELINFFEYNI